MHMLPEVARQATKLKFPLAGPQSLQSPCHSTHYKLPTRKCYCKNINIRLEVGPQHSITLRTCIKLLLQMEHFLLYYLTWPSASKPIDRTTDVHTFKINKIFYCWFCWTAPAAGHVSVQIMLATCGLR